MAAIRSSLPRLVVAGTLLQCVHGRDERVYAASAWTAICATDRGWQRRGGARRPADVGAPGPWRGSERRTAFGLGRLVGDASVVAGDPAASADERAHMAFGREKCSTITRGVLANLDGREHGSDGGLPTGRPGPPVLGVTMSTRGSRARATTGVRRSGVRVMGRSGRRVGTAGADARRRSRTSADAQAVLAPTAIVAMTAVSTCPRSKMSSPGRGTAAMA